MDEIWNREELYAEVWGKIVCHRRGESRYFCGCAGERSRKRQIPLRGRVVLYDFELA